MSQLKEHLERVATTSGRKHTFNFNFSPTALLTTGAGCWVQGSPSEQSHGEQPITAALFHVYPKGL